MKYLHLKFENCGLISCGKSMGVSTSPHLKKTGKISLSTDIDKQNYGHDFSNPIPYTLLSNILLKLCGEIPIPTKKKTPFSERYKRPKEFDEIALNSYIRFYNQDIELDKFNMPKQKEIINTNKWNWQSTAPQKTCFKLANGKTKIVEGFYNWSIFNRHCINDEEFKEKILNLIESIIKINPLTITFDETIFELSKYWDEIDKDFISNEFKNKGCWLNVFFNIECDSSPTNRDTKTPVLVTRGIAYITYLSGEIICPIENEKIIDAIINKGDGSATLLENGMIYVNAIENFEPVPYFKETFNKIF